jgi:hypothetical protein
MQGIIRQGKFCTLRMNFGNGGYDREKGFEEEQKAWEVHAL